MSDAQRVLCGPLLAVDTIDCQSCSNGVDICGAQVFGEEVAILAGDALLALAFEFIARETRNVPAERIVRVRVLNPRPFLQMPAGELLRRQCLSQALPPQLVHAIDLLENMLSRGRQKQNHLTNVAV
jgi:hypothetical protein